MTATERADLNLIEYTMKLFGIVNFSHTLYDPAGGVGPTDFADMDMDRFLLRPPLRPLESARPLVPAPRAGIRTIRKETTWLTR